jgi:hypothetical protein
MSNASSHRLLIHASMLVRKTTMLTSTSLQLQVVSPHNIRSWLSMPCWRPDRYCTHDAAVSLCHALWSRSHNDKARRLHWPKRSAEPPPSDRHSTRQYRISARSMRCHRWQQPRLLESGAVIRRQCRTAARPTASALMPRHAQAPIVPQAFHLQAARRVG